MLTTILNPTAGRATVAGYDVARQGGKVREAIGVALQDVGLDPLMTARELLVLQARALRHAARRGAQDGRAAARDRRPRRRRPEEARRRVLRRHEAPARPGPGAGPRPAHPVPRRADHRPRPGQPRGDLGGGPPPQRRARHDDLPHHPVPRGGRPPGRRGRHHQQGHDRRPGHAGRAQAPGRRRGRRAAVRLVRGRGARRRRARRRSRPTASARTASCACTSRAPPRTCPSWCAPRRRRHPACRA